ncbi:MAG: hypothetical protein FD153_1830, partial [Rhodospirillaceae bacterium]
MVHQSSNDDTRAIAMVGSPLVDETRAKITARNVNVFYGKKHAIK